RMAHRRPSGDDGALPACRDRRVCHSREWHTGGTRVRAAAVHGAVESARNGDDGLSAGGRRCEPIGTRHRPGGGIGMRRRTRQVTVGTVAIGGDAPIAVQSMTTMYTRDVEATVAQIRRLQDVGCELVRVAVPEEIDAQALGAIKRQIAIPLIADIHYD